MRYFPHFFFDSGKRTCSVGHGFWWWILWIYSRCWPECQSIVLPIGSVWLFVAVFFIHRLRPNICMIDAKYVERQWVGRLKCWSMSISCSRSICLGTSCSLGMGRWTSAAISYYSGLQQERSPMAWFLQGPLSDMGVSYNRGTPKSSIYRWFSLINHPFGGTPHIDRLGKSLHAEGFVPDRLGLYYLPVVTKGSPWTPQTNSGPLRPSATARAKSSRVGSWGHRAHWQRPVLLGSSASADISRIWRISGTFFKSTGKQWYTTRFGDTLFWRHLNGSWFWLKWLQYVKVQKPRKHHLGNACLVWTLESTDVGHFLQVDCWPLILGVPDHDEKASGCRVCYQEHGGWKVCVKPIGWVWGVQLSQHVCDVLCTRSIHYEQQAWSWAGFKYVGNDWMCMTLAIKESKHHEQL